MEIVIISLVFLIFVSAFFSGSETGMMAANRYRLQHLAKNKNRAAKRILKLLERPDRVLGIILIGNTFANILASSLATIVTLHYFGEKGIAVATIILTLAILIFAEVTPKTLAALHADKFAAVVSLPLQLLLWLLYPVVWLVNTLANGLLSLFKINIKKQGIDALSQDELRTIVHSSATLIPNKAQSMLLGVFDLKKVSVNDIMVPRSEIAAIDLDDSLDNIKRQIKSLQHTRIPIYRENLDNISGVLHLRKMLHLFTRPDFNKAILESAAAKPYFIPEGTPLTTQLIHFQKNKHRLALVVDEYGTIQGLLTLDDILEEIVGEYTTSIASNIKDIYPQADGTYLVDARITLRELNRELKCDFPTDGPKTLNGLILEYLETIPQSGISLRLHGYPMEIKHIKGNRIKMVKIMPNLKKRSQI